MLLGERGEGEQAVIFLIAALAVAITHHRNTNLPSLVGLVSSVQLTVPGQLFSGVWGSCCWDQRLPLLIFKLYQLKQRKRNHIGSWLNIPGEAPLSRGCPLQLSGAGADPLEVHIPRICSSTTTRCHNPGQGQEEAAFSFCSFLSPSKSSRVVSRISSSGNKCWDHAGDG